MYYRRSFVNLSSQSWKRKDVLCEAHFPPYILTEVRALLKECSLEDEMKLRTNVKAGGLALTNHNEWLSSARVLKCERSMAAPEVTNVERTDEAKRSEVSLQGFRLKTHIRAAGLGSEGTNRGGVAEAMNHNERLVPVEGVQPQDS